MCSKQYVFPGVRLLIPPRFPERSTHSFSAITQAPNAITYLNVVSVCVCVCIDSAYVCVYVCMYIYINI